MLCMASQITSRKEVDTGCIAVTSVLHECHGQPHQHYRFCVSLPTWAMQSVPKAVYLRMSVGLHFAAGTEG